MKLNGIKFPVQISDSLRIEKKPFLGQDQYYLYRGKTRLRLLDPEEAEELLDLI